MCFIEYPIKAKMGHHPYIFSIKGKLIDIILKLTFHLQLGYSASL